MGGKRRNKNKADRDDYAIAASSSSKKQSEASSTAEDSDTESFATHLTLDETTEEDAEEFDIICEESLISTRLSEIFENATHKAISIRIAALDSLKVLLSRQYIADELENWKATAVDIIEKTLRRSDEEAFRAAVIASLLSLELGDLIGDEMDCLVALMRDICADGSKPERLRVQCAHSASICAFISLSQATAISQLAGALRAVWMNTKANALSSNVFNAALAGWTLLVCQAGRRTLEAALLDQPKLCSFLEGSQVEMRLNVGEALTVLYEAAISMFGDSYRFANHQHLLDILAKLSTDSLKFRAKRDRRMQRFSFRQIFAHIKDQETPSIRIKFGNEALELDSCGKKLVYDLICGILQGGMNNHLKTNPLVRDLFDLQPISEDASAKMSKHQKMAIRNALSKTRDLHRAKQRDKRAC